MGLPRSARSDNGHFCHAATALWTTCLSVGWRMVKFVPFLNCPLLRRKKNQRNPQKIVSKYLSCGKFRFKTFWNSVMQSYKWIQQLIAPVPSPRFFPTGCPTQVTFARTALAGKDSCEIGTSLQINVAAGKKSLRFNMPVLFIIFFLRAMNWFDCHPIIRTLEKAESYHLTTYIFYQKVT